MNGSKQYAMFLLCDIFLPLQISACFRADA